MRKHIKRKDNILITAIEILDESGIQGMTTKEIAKRQNITEPAIYRQFSGKKDIILAILKRFSDFDNSIFDTIIEQKMSCRVGLNYFMNTYSEYYQSYPEITIVMISIDLFKYDIDTNEKMNSIVKNRLKILKDLILDGQKKGEFSKAVDAEEIADLILGILLAGIFNWKINNCSFDLKPKLLTSFEISIGNLFIKVN